MVCDMKKWIIVRSDGRVLMSCGNWCKDIVPGTMLYDTPGEVFLPTGPVILSGFMGPEPFTVKMEEVELDAEEVADVLKNRLRAFMQSEAL